MEKTGRELANDERCGLPDALARLRDFDFPPKSGLHALSPNLNSTALTQPALNHTARPAVALPPATEMSSNAYEALSTSERNQMLQALLEQFEVDEWPEFTSCVIPPLTRADCPKHSLRTLIHL